VGDFLVMAATLCQLKSRELLPRDPALFAEEEDENPAQRLIRRLIEFERYKCASEEMMLRPQLGRDVFCRPQGTQAVERPLCRDVAPMELAEAYGRLLKLRDAPEPTHNIEFETWSLEKAIEWVLETLEQGKSVPLADLFLSAESRSQRVQTFMAVLEMARMGYADVHQEHHLGAVSVTSMIAREEADLSMLKEA
jgi:segregation and condensation protein A